MEKFAGIRNQRAANRISKAGGKGLVLPTRGLNDGPVTIPKNKIGNANGLAWLFSQAGTAGDFPDFTFSGWFYYLVPNGAEQKFFTTSNLSAASRYEVSVFGNDGRHTGNNAGGAVFRYDTPGVFPPSLNSWHNIVWSRQASTLTNQLAIDGVLTDPDLVTQDTGLGASVRANYGLLATFDGQLPFIGLTGELWWNPDFVDLTVDLDKFVTGTGSGARPADLGPRGEGPTGFTPQIFAGGDMTANTGGFGNGGASVDNTGWNGGCNNGSTAMEKGGAQLFTDEP
jgi:hypothetical protein